MKTLNFVRAGGLAMIISGLALGYSYISHPHQMPPEVIASGSWIIIHAFFAISLVLGLLGTTALYAVTATRAGRLGALGFIMLHVGMMLIFGLNYYEVFIAPFLAVHYLVIITDHGAGETIGAVAIAFPAAGLLTVIGYAMLGAAWNKTRVLPGGVALALVATSIAFGVGLSPVGGIAIAQITAAAFGAALIATGVCALRRQQNFAPAAHRRRP